MKLCRQFKTRKQYSDIKTVLNMALDKLRKYKKRYFIARL